MKKIIATLLLMIAPSMAFSADLNGQRVAYIQRQQAAVNQLLRIMSVMRDLRLEYDSQGYSGTFTDENLQSAGLDNMTADNFTSVIVSEQAITDLLAANGNGHYTNLYRIYR